MPGCITARFRPYHPSLGPGRGGLLALLTAIPGTSIRQALLAFMPRPLNQLRVRSASDLRCESGIVGVLRATGPQMEPRPQEGFRHRLGDLSPVFTTRSA